TNAAFTLPPTPLTRRTAQGPLLGPPSAGFPHGTQTSGPMPIAIQRADLTVVFFCARLPAGAAWPGRSLPGCGRHAGPAGGLAGAFPKRRCGHLRRVAGGGGPAAAAPDRPALPPGSGSAACGTPTRPCPVPCRPPARCSGRPGCPGTASAAIWLVPSLAADSPAPTPRLFVP